MATTKHKAATAVTLAPLAERSAFEVFVHKYWMHAAGAAIAITVGTLVWHQSRSSDLRARTESWDKLMSAAGLDAFQQVPAATPATLGELSTQLKDSAAGPWAKLLEARAHLAERNHTAARAALEALRRDHPTHALNQAGVASDGSASGSAVERMLQAIEQQESWDAAHGGLYANPPPPADAPRVRMKTDQGDVVLTLYVDRAPQHVANFLALGKEGYFDGTKFHALVTGTAVEGGDPLSRTETDATKWGQGPSDKVLASEATGLYHFAGVMTASAGPTKGESSGNRFALTCEANHVWDGERVVFGVVTEGLEVVRTISNGPLVAGSSSVPAQPVTLVKVEQL